LFRVLRVKLQIQFSLIDAMLMGLKLIPSSTNKYITGTLNKGREGKGREGKGREGGREGGRKGGRNRDRERERKGKGRKGMGRV
jgi:hypothetical protein